VKQKKKRRSSVYKCCARAQFSGCSSTTKANSETGQMAVCCQNLTLGALSSRRALSMLVGALFKKFSIRRTACACDQFSGCSSTTNSHSETGKMALCCQNLTLGALSSRSALSVLVGALFKEFGLFLNTPRMWSGHTDTACRSKCLITSK
jgi:uncharacterized integral membrane protein